DIGAVYYTDRATFVITNVGPVLQKGVLIRTPNDDKKETNSTYLTFKLSSPAMVYVVYAGRATSLPEWLENWQLMQEKIETNDGNPLSKVYARRFPAGTVILGGNLQPPAQGSDSNYFVIVQRK